MIFHNKTNHIAQTIDFNKATITNYNLVNYCSYKFEVCSHGDMSQMYADHLRLIS